MIGQSLGHYRILEKVAAGGMGVVYRAHDEQLERDVALKVLPSGTLSNDASRREFRKVALALAKLSHPNIETVCEFDTQDGVDFLVRDPVLPSAPERQPAQRGVLNSLIWLLPCGPNL
jgi:serine/threonine protein kinase